MLSQARESDPPKAAPRRAQKAPAKRLSRIGCRLIYPPRVRDLTRVDKTTKNCRGKRVFAFCPEADRDSRLSHTVRATTIDGCRKADCSGCVRSYGSRRAKKQWSAWAGALSAWGFELSYFVFPLPAEIREQADARVLGRMRRRIVDGLFSEIRRANALPDWYQLGALEVTHPAGDRDPDAWTPHFNLIVPSVAFQQDPVNPAPVRLKTWWTRPRLARLRALWKAIILEETGHEIPGDADVFHEYRREIPAQKHVLRYNLRSFPGWPAWTRAARTFGFLSKRSVGEWRDALARIDGRDIRVKWNDREDVCDVPGCGRALVILDPDAPGAFVALDVWYGRSRAGPGGPGVALAQVDVPAMLRADDGTVAGGGHQQRILDFVPGVCA